MPSTSIQGFWAAFVSLENSSVASSCAGAAPCLARNEATGFMFAVSGITIPALSAMHASSGRFYCPNLLERTLQVRRSADSLHAY